MKKATAPLLSVVSQADVNVASGVTGLLLAISQQTDPEILSQVIKQAQARKLALAAVHVSQLRGGDTVIFAQNIRPTYLRGLTATVVHVNDKSVTVNIPQDPRYGRFSGSKRCRLPISLVQL